MYKLGLVAATLLAAGCRDSVAPDRHAPGGPAFVEVGTQPAIRGLGTLGTGDPTPGSDRQEFDFDVSSDLTGRLFYRDWRFSATITVDEDPATRITAFRPGSSACAAPENGAEFDGIGRRSTGVLYEGFTVVACDDGAAGSGADGLGITTVTEYSNAGLLSSGDIVKTVVASPIPPPVASFTFSCSGLTCSFDASSSTAQAAATYSWTFGDGGTSTAQNPSHTYGTGGTYTVRLTVTDNRGATNSVSKTVTVTQPNRAPTVNAGSDERVLLGLLYTFSASFSDPDNGPWSYTIYWGDGSSTSGTKSSQGTISGGHNYVLPGSYTIRVTVTDSRGASGSDTKVLTVLIDLGGIL